MSSVSHRAGRTDDNNGSLVPGDRPRILPLPLMCRIYIAQRSRGGVLRVVCARRGYSENWGGSTAVQGVARGCTQGCIGSEGVSGGCG